MRSTCPVRHAHTFEFAAPRSLLRAPTGWPRARRYKRWAQHFGFRATALALCALSRRSGKLDYRSIKARRRRSGVGEPSHRLDSLRRIADPWHSALDGSVFRARKTVAGTSRAGHRAPTFRLGASRQAPDAGELRRTYWSGSPSPRPCTVGWPSRHAAPLPTIGRTPREPTRRSQLQLISRACRLPCADARDATTSLPSASQAPHPCQTLWRPRTHRVQSS